MNLEEMKKHIEENILGFPAPKSSAYFMYVKLKVTEEEKKHYLKDENGNVVLGADGNAIVSLIEIQRAEAERDRVNGIVGMVVSQGPQAYSREIEQGYEPRCKLGDWILFPNNAGLRVNYRGVPMQIIFDDDCRSVIEDPEYITRD